MSTCFSCCSQICFTRLAQSNKASIKTSLFLCYLQQVAKLMGKVFLQKSAVNLLSTVLDTPEWLWSQPDYLQVQGLAVGAR